MVAQVTTLPRGVFLTQQEVTALDLGLCMWQHTPIAEEAIGVLPQ